MSQMTSVMIAMLEKNLDDGILTIRLAHGKASALDLELCNALRERIRRSGGG